MSRIYGPVPSRRLGQSLGVDPVPFKACNYNCVYCQLGRTTPVIHERKDFFPPEDILAEVRRALAAHRSGEIDYVTFVGQGEPLLCASLGRLLRGVRALTQIPIAVITNGSLMSRSEVRHELGVADVVIPSLDAADQATFRRIVRPGPELKVGEIIEGMAAFRDIFRGQLWIEVMLVKGLNDSEPVLVKLARALGRIRPDQVHVNTPVRPPAEAWVEPPASQGLMRAIAILGEVATVLTPAQGSIELAPDMEPEDAVVEIIRRHPIREQELLKTLARFGTERLKATLAALVESERAIRHSYRGQVFWEYAGGRFGRPRRAVDHARTSARLPDRVSSGGFDSGHSISTEP
jgi:wyosine [tRNA(Phe)-imidazoG37] synthetase (radical SAM superfamily)